MPYVLALHEVNDILADVPGMVADTLQSTRRPHDIHGTPDVTPVLQHHGHLLTQNRLVLAVYLGVLAGDGHRQLRIKTHERIQRITHHLAAMGAQVLNFHIPVLRGFHVGQGAGELADLLGFVPDALKVRDHFGDGQHQS